MLGKISAFVMFAIITIMTIAHAENDAKIPTSKGYVMTTVETRQDKIPAANQPNADAGETVMTYTDDGNGVIGERGIYTGADGYTESTDADKLITASALNDAFTSLPTTDTTTLECANPGTCSLWNIVEQTAYREIINLAPQNFTIFTASNGQVEIIAHANEYSYDFTFSPTSSTSWLGIVGFVYITEGHKYYVRAEMSSSVPAILSITFGNGLSPNGVSKSKTSMIPNEMYLLHGIFTATTTGTPAIYIRCGYAAVGGPYTGKAHNIGIFDLTEIFGAGNEPATPEAAQAAIVF